MFSARRLVGLSVLMAALIGCGGAPAVTKDRAATELIPPPRTGPRRSQHGPLPIRGNWSKSARSRTPTGDIGTPVRTKRVHWTRAISTSKERSSRATRQKLTLELKNVADQVHNFSLPTQGLDQDIPPRSDPRVNVDVTFPASGELQFLCKYHTAHGMGRLLLLSDAGPQSVAEPCPRQPRRGDAASLARPTRTGCAATIGGALGGSRGFWKIGLMIIVRSVRATPDGLRGSSHPVLWAADTGLQLSLETALLVLLRTVTLDKLNR